MNLTKEECEQALKDVWYIAMTTDYVNKYDFKNGKHVANSKYQKYHRLLLQLIKEHFDNTPLTFEQLKEGMWIWDNTCKKYVKILHKHKEEYLCYLEIASGHFGVLNIIFEENRFYRREVEENNE